MFTLNELYLLRMLVNMFRPVRNYINVHFCNVSSLEPLVNSLDRKLFTLINEYESEV